MTNKLIPPWTSTSMQTSSPASRMAAEAAIGTASSPAVLPVPLAVLVSMGVAILCYWGASARPLLVPQPFFAALITGVCFLLLLLPLMTTARNMWAVLSPEIMGGIGYFMYIGLGAFTNQTWPGLAVNPSLFSYLPIGVAAQTAGALAFFGGTVVARRAGPYSRNRETIPGRLALVMLAYASFTLYLSFAMPRVDAQRLRALTLVGETVSWLYSVGPMIVFQALPMFVAAWIYLRKARFLLIRAYIMLAFAFSVLLYLVSGSRTYATQMVFLLFSAYIIAVRRVRRAWVLAIVGLSIAVLATNTWLRLSGEALVNVNLGTFLVQDILARAEAMRAGAYSVGIEGMMQNVHENVVYHLSDNQAMAMLIRNLDEGFLFGRGLFASFLSSLPRQFRPIGYQSSIQLIMSQYLFYKEQPADVPYWPDWQMSIGVMGFADFGPIGLVLYPFLAGIAARWLYNRAVLTSGLGEAGWLLYMPVVFVLWNPLLYGPDGTQALRLLVPLAVALRWTARERTAQATPSLATPQPSPLSQR